jgi:hypothetical protein
VNDSTELVGWPDPDLKFKKLKNRPSKTDDQPMLKIISGRLQTGPEYVVFSPIF